MDDDDYQVSSELYEEHNYFSELRPSLNEKNVVSKFKFKLPEKPQVDKDGDLVVSRKSDEKCICIEHSKSTILNLVGLQVWRGALLLADWLIYNKDSLLPNKFILELGSGVGLTSIVASMYQPTICTDISLGGLLELIEHNINKNKSITRHATKVLELDFMKSEFSPEIEEILPEVNIILAADVVYDDKITKAFVDTVHRILSKPPQKTIYVALEKRYVFTVADCDTCAPCYEYFLECLASTSIKSESVPIDFPQYFEYDRVKELVLWKLSS